MVKGWRDDGDVDCWSIDDAEPLLRMQSTDPSVNVAHPRGSYGGAGRRPGPDTQRCTKHFNKRANKLIDAKRQQITTMGRVSEG